MNVSEFLERVRDKDVIRHIVENGHNREFAVLREFIHRARKEHSNSKDVRELSDIINTSAASAINNYTPEKTASRWLDIVDNVTDPVYVTPIDKTSVIRQLSMVHSPGSRIMKKVVDRFGDGVFKDQEVQRDVMWASVRCGRAENVKYFRELGVGNENPYICKKALQLAVRFYDPNVVETLVSSGVDINSRAKDGTTIVNSIAHVDGEAMKKLLELGFDPNLTDRKNQKPIHVIARSVGTNSGQSLTAIDELIKAGASVAEPDTNGVLPIHRVASKVEAWGWSEKNKDVLSKLIPENDPDARAKLAIPRPDGESVQYESAEWSPLALVAFNTTYNVSDDAKAVCAEQLCKALVEKGADPHLANHAGQTPVDYALKNVPKWEKCNLIRIMSESQKFDLQKYESSIRKVEDPEMRILAVEKSQEFLGRDFGKDVLAKDELNPSGMTIDALLEKIESSGQKAIRRNRELNQQVGVPF